MIYGPISCISDKLEGRGCACMKKQAVGKVELASTTGSRGQHTNLSPHLTSSFLPYPIVSCPMLSSPLLSYPILLCALRALIKLCLKKDPNTSFHNPVNTQNKIFIEKLTVAQLSKKWSFFCRTLTLFYRVHRTLKSAPILSQMNPAANPRTIML